MVFVLGDERWPVRDVRCQPAPCGFAANLGLGRSGLLVCPQQRIHEYSYYANTPLDARAWRHPVRAGCRGASYLCVRRSTTARDPIGFMNMSAAACSRFYLKNSLTGY